MPGTTATFLSDGGGLSQQTRDNLAVAAALFVFFRLVVAAFALMGIRGRLFSGRLSCLRYNRRRNLGGL